MDGMEPMIVSLVFSGVIFIAVAVALVVQLRFRRTYVFAVHSHEAAVKIMATGMLLYVDGVLEEQLSGRSLRRATLHATVDGEEFKAHVSVGSFYRIRIEATLGGREVALTRVVK